MRHKNYIIGEGKNLWRNRLRLQDRNKFTKCNAILLIKRQWINLGRRIESKLKSWWKFAFCKWYERNKLKCAKPVDQCHWHRYPHTGLTINDSLKNCIWNSLSDWFIHQDPARSFNPTTCWHALLLCGRASINHAVETWERWTRNDPKISLLSLWIMESNLITSV